MVTAAYHEVTARLRPPPGAGLRPRVREVPGGKRWERRAHCCTRSVTRGEHCARGHIDLRASPNAQLAEVGYTCAVSRQGGKRGGLIDRGIELSGSSGQP